ncbi:transporter substrate-binding domain-containing protein [Pseudodesulfovibrio sp.]|uniref:transporter substrate-binding domain-containing protein n=1 Tax=unclassified Pseudodesulfovibrio TaxID=2661612 RepID=UPI003AFF8E4E
MANFAVLDWGGIITDLSSRKVDMVMASMTITEERRKSVAEGLACKSPRIHRRGHRSRPAKGEGRSAEAVQRRHR